VVDAEELVRRAAGEDELALPGYAAIHGRGRRDCLLSFQDANLEPPQKEKPPCRICDPRVM
jgi:hypothetical protein